MLANQMPANPDPLSARRVTIYAALGKWFRKMPP